VVQSGGTGSGTIVSSGGQQNPGRLSKKCTSLSKKM
jgi:hypothetical protein